jgi:hypothetical protein
MATTPEIEREPRRFSTAWLVAAGGLFFGGLAFVCLVRWVGIATGMSDGNGFVAMLRFAAAFALAAAFAVRYDRGFES